MRYGGTSYQIKEKKIKTLRPLFLKYQDNSIEKVCKVFYLLVWVKGVWILHPLSPHQTAAMQLFNLLDLNLFMYEPHHHTFRTFPLWIIVIMMLYILIAN